MKSRNTFVPLSLLAVLASRNVTFNQKLYAVFLGNSLNLTLNFSNDSDLKLSISYEKLEIIVGPTTVMTCERLVQMSGPVCSGREEITQHFRHPFLLSELTLTIQVNDASPSLGDRILAVFFASNITFEAVTDIVVLGDPVCNASFRETPTDGLSFNGGHLRSISEETELSENTVIVLWCGINSYHRMSDFAVIPSWKSIDTILLRVTNVASGRMPLTSTQRATFAVNRISRFESIFCEVQIPDCEAKDCLLIPNGTKRSEDEDYNDMDGVYEYGNEDIDDDDDGDDSDDLERGLTEVCEMNETRCRCFLKIPKMAYCADEVDIIEEKAPNGSIKLTCKAQSSPPSNIVWESSDPSFKVSREPTIIVSMNAIYTCKASLPLHRLIKCEVRFKSVDLKNWTTISFENWAVSATAAVLLILCLCSVGLVIKGVFANNKKVLRDKESSRFVRSHNEMDSGNIDPLRPSTIKWKD